MRKLLFVVLMVLMISPVTFAKKVKMIPKSQSKIYKMSEQIFIQKENELAKYVLQQYYQGRQFGSLQWCYMNSIQDQTYPDPWKEGVVELTVKTGLNACLDGVNGYSYPDQFLMALTKALVSSFTCKHFGKFCDVARRDYAVYRRWK